MMPLTCPYESVVRREPEVRFQRTRLGFDAIFTPFNSLFEVKQFFVRFGCLAGPVVDLRKKSVRPTTGLILLDYFLAKVMCDVEILVVKLSFIDQLPGFSEKLFLCFMETQTIKKLGIKK